MTPSRRGKRYHLKTGKREARINLRGMPGNGEVLLMRGRKCGRRKSNDQRKRVVASGKEVMNVQIHTGNVEEVMVCGMDTSLGEN